MTKLAISIVFMCGAVFLIVQRDTVFAYHMKRLASVKRSNDSTYTVSNGILNDTNNEITLVLISSMLGLSGLLLLMNVKYATIAFGSLACALYAVYVCNPFNRSTSDIDTLLQVISTWGCILYYGGNHEADISNEDWEEFYKWKAEEDERLRQEEKKRLKGD